MGAYTGYVELKSTVQARGLEAEWHAIVRYLAGGRRSYGSKGMRMVTDTDRGPCGGAGMAQLKH